MPHTIQLGEKFGLLLVHMEPMETVTAPIQLSKTTWLMPKSPVELVDGEWAKWLGSLTADALKEANLCLLHKFKSKNPEVLDDENTAASHHLQQLYQCLLLHGIPWIHGDAHVFTGARVGSKAEPRNYTRVRSYYHLDEVHPAGVTQDSLLSAARAQESLAKIYERDADFARFRRGYHSLVLAMAEDIWDFRLHNYVRAVEALIQPREGKTRRDFIHRGQTLCRASQATADVLGSIYDARCAVEHLNDWRVAEDPSALIENMNRRLLVRRAEVAAMRSYLHILIHPQLLSVYSDEITITGFWSKPDHEKTAIWGEQIDVSQVKWETDQYGIEQLT